MEIEEEVLARVTPRPEEEAHLHRAVQALREVVARRAQELGLTVEILEVGSVARGTHLRDPDVDLFVAFPPTTPREDLRRYGLQLGEVLQDGRTMYAEHPYTRGRFMGVDVEVVPCYKLERATDKMTAVDRTPFHTLFIRERMTEALRASIRLLKQFAKGVGVYGAEAKVQGFSGYLCELLVLVHGGFRPLLQAARSWRPGIIITLGVGPSRAFPEPLVVVDPVDPGRNVASAVSLEQLTTFVLAANEYLERPSLAFFFPAPSRPWSLAHIRKELRTRGYGVVELSFKAPEVTEDILYPQLWKCRSTLVDLLHRRGFRVKDTHLHQPGDGVVLLLLMELEELPGVRQHQGPPPWVKNALDFLTKWTEDRVLAGPYLKGEHIMVDVAREHRRAHELLEAEVSGLSLGKNVDEAVAAGFTVRHGAEVVRAANATPLTELLTRELPWKRSTSQRRKRSRVPAPGAPGHPGP